MIGVETFSGHEAPTRLVAGIPFRVTTFQGTVDWIISLAIGPRRALTIRFLNAWNVALAHRDAQYRSLLARSGINFPDGKPVVWVLRSRDSGGRTADQVRGPSLFEEVMRQGVEANVRHYLLGGSPEVLDRLIHALSSRFPGIQIAGSFAPPFAPLTRGYLDECVERISPTRPDLVWVGLGTPKQDFAGCELCAALGVPVLGVGAAFDFAAGAKREAPAWIQRCGFEWLFRLVSEPRRLWRRYLLGNIRFIAAVLAEWAADRHPASRRH